MERDVISKAAVRWTLLTIISIFLIGLIYVGWRSDQRSEGIEENAVSTTQNQNDINKITSRQQILIDNQCLESRRAAMGINEVLDALIEGAKISTVFDPAEKDARIKRYQSVKMTIVVCKP